MNASQGSYNLVSQTELNQWDESLQQAVPGYRVTARSAQNGTIFTVFVPRAQYSPENVDALVRHQLATIDAVHNLGG